MAVTLDNLTRPKLNQSLAQAATLSAGTAVEIEGAPIDKIYIPLEIPSLDPDALIVADVITDGSAVLQASNAGDFDNVLIGDAITGTNIDVGAVVTDFDKTASPPTVTMDLVATGSGTNAATFDTASGTVVAGLLELTFTTAGSTVQIQAIVYVADGSYGTQSISAGNVDAIIASAAATSGPALATLNYDTLLSSLRIPRTDV